MPATIELHIQRLFDGSLTATLRVYGRGVTMAASPQAITIDVETLIDLRLLPDAYGAALSAMVFSAPLREAWAKIQGHAEAKGTGIHLRVLIDDLTGALHALRWELLRDPLTNTPLARQESGSLARLILSASLHDPDLPPKPDLRALIAVAGPADAAHWDLAQVDVAGEAQRAMEALGAIPADLLAHGHASSSGRATLAAIRNALRTPAHIFCLIAHSQSTGAGTTLYLEHDDGTAAPITGANLAEAIDALAAAHHPLLAVLVACDGGSQEDAPLASAGPLLAHAGIPAVIAMQAPISMAAATKFTAHLLRELDRDGRIDRALAAARAEMGDEWWVPVLWLRSRDGRLWDNKLSETDRLGLLSAPSNDQIAAQIQSESSFIRQEVQLQAAETQARLDILPAMDAKQDLAIEMMRQVLRHLPLGDTSGGTSSNGAQDAVATQIDMVRKLVQDNHFMAARKILIALQAQLNENEAAKDSRAQVANLLGSCAFGLDELDVAQNHFDEAVKLAPNNGGILANGAMVALLCNRLEVALELSTQARRLDSRATHATAAYIQALHRLGRAEELEQLLREEPWILEQAVSITALASIKYERGEYEEAESLLRRAINLDASEPQMHILLAHSIFKPLTARSLAFTQIDQHTNERLRTVEEALSQAVALYEEGDDQVSLHAVLVSRAGVRCIQGKQEDGLADCDRVLYEDAENRGALENKGRILLNLDRTQEAIRCFESLLGLSAPELTKPRRYRATPIGRRPTNIPALLASAYVDIGQFTKAIEVLLPRFRPSPDDLDQLDMAEVLLVAQSRKADIAAVTDTLKIIETTWPQQPEAKAILAEHFARQQDYPRAIRLLQETVGLSEGVLRRTFTLRIAYFMYRDKQYEEAVDVLRPIVEKSSDNSDLWLFITCLYNSQQLTEALPLAQRIREQTGVVPGVSEIEARIREKGGDVKQAHQIWQLLLQAEPANIGYQIEAAYTAWRARDIETAKRLTLNVSYEAIKDHPTHLIHIARLRALLQLPDALVFAYQARRIASRSPDIHVQYMMLCLQMEVPEQSNAQLVPIEVGVDTAVHLARNGKTTTFLIVDDEPAQHDTTELSVNDTLAQKLLGKRRGDRVAIQGGIFGAPEHEITDIQSKYIFASHQTTRLFGQGNLHHPAFHADDTTGPDFAERFARFLDQRAQLQPDIQRLYTEQGIPLSTFAHMIGRSTIDVWLAFVETPGERLYLSTGTPEEAEIQGQVLSASTAIVVDLLALLTIVHLSLEEVITRRFEAILMPQALLDQLHTYEQELNSPQPRAVVGSSAGQRYFLEIPQAYFEKKHELLRRVLAFAHDKVQVCPTMGLIEADQELVEILGEAEITSLLLAKERNIALYCDDLRMRTVATEHWQVRGFDTQNLLNDVRNRNLFAVENCYNALSKLARSNYQYIRINAEILVFILEQSGMSITEEVRSLFSLLHGPQCTPESAIHVIADLIRLIWIRRMLHRQKLFILDFALITLFKGRKSDTIISLFKAQIRNRFQLLIHMLPEIWDHIDYWAQQSA